MYHGWSDGGSDGSISAWNTVSYYESVLKHMGRARTPARTERAPKLHHRRQSQPKWRHRHDPPLGPCPQQAVYKGSGSTNDAVNYTCQIKGN